MVEQAVVLVKLVDLAHEDFLNHVIGFAGDLLAVDVFLFLDHVGGNVVATDIKRHGGSDVHADVFAKAFGDLAVGFNHHAEEGAFTVDVGKVVLQKRSFGRWRC